MKVFWNDNGRGVASQAAHEASLEEAQSIWSDEVRGMEGNFLGLIDDAGNTIQFYFDAGIGDDVDDASHLAIVLMDFPRPTERGSYSATVTVGDVYQLLEKAFLEGASHQNFEQVGFVPW